MKILNSLLSFMDPRVPKLRNLIPVWNLLPPYNLAHLASLKKHLSFPAFLWGGSICILTFGAVSHPTEILGVASTSFIAFVTSLRPSTLYSAYFGNAELPRFLTGSLALGFALFGVILLPHLIIQTFLLIRDWRMSTLGTFRNFLQERQTRLHQEYYALLCSAGGESTNQSAGPSQASLFHSIWSGLRYAYFSFESWTVTASLYTHLWNSWFAFRSFFPLFHPLIGVSQLCFPNFFRTAIALEGRVVTPTSMNGGTRNRLSQTYLFLFYPELLTKLRAIDAAILNILRNHPQDQQAQIEFYLKTWNPPSQETHWKKWYLSTEDSLKLQLASKLRLLSTLPASLPLSPISPRPSWSEWVARPGGHLNFPHLWPGQIPPGNRASKIALA